MCSLSRDATVIRADDVGEKPSIRPLMTSALFSTRPPTSLISTPSFTPSFVNTNVPLTRCRRTGERSNIAAMRPASVSGSVGRRVIVERGTPASSIQRTLSYTHRVPAR